MSPAEVSWRIRSGVRDRWDRCLPPSSGGAICVDEMACDSNALFRADLWPHWPQNGVVGWVSVEAQEWRSRVIDQAGRILANRITLFDLADHPLGDEINWNYEYKARRATPMRPAQSIDYRDYAEVGDCKFAWELSRHHHLVTLGRAYRLTGRVEYARRVVADVESWIRQCPFGMGMQWRSPLELAIRLINWVWAFELIRPSGLLDQAFVELAMPVVYRHIWDVSRKYSRYSSANNHTIGEAAGVYIASAYFHTLRNARKWREESRQLLLEEIERQTHTDGGNREQAMSYHLFVLEFFLLAGLMGRSLGEDFSAEYWGQVERMIEFVAALKEGGDELPMYGDADDGFVLDLGGRLGSGCEFLAIGAILFGRADFKQEAGVFSEPAYWLFGEPGYHRFQAIDVGSGPALIASRALTNTGLYLLQSGHRGQSDRLSLIVDGGELGFGTIAAHGHADALSLHLRIGGQDVLVDPGTFDYFTYPEWRAYFRSTRAHNTVEVDGVDQSESLGPFLWGERASSRCLQWQPEAWGGEVVLEHDGYTRLRQPVMHRRHVRMDSRVGEIVVQDVLEGGGEHTAVMSLHFSDECNCIDFSDERIRISYPGGVLIIEIDLVYKVQKLFGALNPMAGWISRGYHCRKPTLTILGHARWKDRLAACIRMRIDDRP